MVAIVGKQLDVDPLLVGARGSKGFYQPFDHAGVHLRMVEQYPKPIGIESLDRHPIAGQHLQKVEKGGLDRSVCVVNKVDQFVNVVLPAIQTHEEP